MNKHADVIFGFVAAGTTYALDYASTVLAIITGLLAAGIMLIRFLKEWRHRND